MSTLFRLLEVDRGVGSNKATATILPYVAVEIKRGSRLSFEWDVMYARYLISLSKFKLKEQSCFAADLNIMHIHRLQAALHTILKYTQDNKLNQ